MESPSQPATLQEGAVVRRIFRAPTLALVFGVGALLGGGAAAFGYLAYSYWAQPGPPTKIQPPPTTLMSPPTTLPSPLTTLLSGPTTLLSPSATLLSPLTTLLSGHTTLLSPPPTERGGGTVCDTPGCHDTAAFLQDSLNPSINPCSNFSQYVCGRLPEDAGSTIQKVVARISRGLGDAMLRYVKNLVPDGARYKAAVLLAQCLAVAHANITAREDLQDLVNRLVLHVHTPPPSAPTGPDNVLALHVELAYSYGLSGLLHIQPRARRSLSIDFNTKGWLEVVSIEKDYQTDMQQLGGRSRRLASELADVAGFTKPPDLGTKMQQLYDTVKGVVAKVANSFVGGITDVTPPAVIEVKDLAFTGVSPTAFADAIVAKTPYRREASLFESPFLKAVLETLWQAMNSTDLFFWTSWYVLDMASPFVGTASAMRLGEGVFFLSCVRMVSHVIESGLAAMMGLNNVTNKAKAQIADITNSVASCLSGKRWTPSVPTSPRLVVGFSSHASNIQRLDAFYEQVFIDTNAPFFRNWLAAVQMRSLDLTPEYDHVKELTTGIYVATDGTVLVPAILLTAPFFTWDGPVAANVGGLGHLIAKKLVERYYVGPGNLSVECQALAAKEGGDFQSLLAYTCVGPTLSAMNATSKELPSQIAGLSEEKLAYATGCLKDCKINPGHPPTCSASAEGLKEFEEAFACTSQGRPPGCLLS